MVVAIVLFCDPIEGFHTTHKVTLQAKKLTTTRHPPTVLAAPLITTTDGRRAIRSPLFFASVTADPSNNEDASSSSSEEWTKPRLHNTATFRSLALLSALALAGYSSSPQKILSSQALATVHLLSFATWFGSVAYTTFVAGITMFKNLPRQTFGKLQAKLFPKYFALGSVTLILQLVSLSSLSVLKISSSALLPYARASA